MRLTDKKRDELLGRIESLRRQVLDASIVLQEARDKIASVDGELALIQGLAKSIEANQTQEPE